MTLQDAEHILASLEALRLQALDTESSATRVRQTLDKDIQNVKRLVRELKREPLPLAKRPGDWTEKE